MQRLSALFWLLALAYFAPAAQAATLVVSTTPAAGEYASIQAAVDAAQAGDTIRIEAGTYPEALHLRGRAVTLEGEAATEVVIDARQRGPVVNLPPTSGTTVLRRLTLTGGLAERGGGMLSRSADVELEQVRFVRNEAVKAGGAAYLSGGRVKVRESEVLENRAEQAGGLYLTDTIEPSINGTAFVKNRGILGAALRMEGRAGPVTGCLFLENGRTPDGEGVTGETSIFLKTGPSGGVRIANNTFLRNGCCHLSMRATSGVVIENNIFADGAGYAVILDQTRHVSPPAGKAVTIAYNDVYRNLGEYKFIAQDGVGTEYTVAGQHGNLAVDPKFTQATGSGWETLNLHPAAGSACIDAGNPASAQKDVDGSRNDQGMYGGPAPASW